MSNGGIIGKPNSPTVDSASGVWSLNEQNIAASAGTWPVIAGDEDFELVTLILSTDSVDGGQNNTFTDSSSSGHTITRGGDTTQGSISVFDDYWSNYFAGGVGGDNLVVANTGTTIGTSDFTIEGWFYFDGIGGGTVYTILDGRTGGDTSNLMWAQEANGNWTILNGAGSNISSGWTSNTFTTGQWYHIAQTRTGGTSRFFKNGTLTGSPADTSSYDSQQYTVGGRYAPNGSNLYGYLSNFRIVVGTALYTSAFTPPTAPLSNIAGTLILTAQSYGFKDNSTNDFGITPTGTPEVKNFTPFAPTSAYSASSGASAYFDGDGDYLAAPSSTDFGFGTGDFTIELWAYFESFSSPDSSTIIIVYDGRPSSTNGAYPTLNITSGALTYYVTGNSGSPLISGSTTLSVNSWYHIALSRSGSSTKLFLNGTQEGSTYSDSTNYATSAPYIFASGFFSPPAYESTGYVAGVRIVKGTAVYTSDFTPPTEPFTAISGTTLLLNFEDAAIYDSSQSNNLVTAADAQVDTAVTKFGSSVKFDGTGDYLQMPVNTVLNFGSADFTIEGWINVASIDSTYRGILSIGAPVQIYSRSGTIECYFNDTDGSGSYIVSGLLGPSSSITADTWHHIAVVRDGTTFTAYVDGVAGTPVTGVSAAVALSATKGIIGAYSTSLYPFTGYIEDLRVTKGLARYTSGFTPPTAAFPRYGE